MKSVWILDTLVKFNLKKGQQLEAADMAEIQKYDHYRIGLNKAIQYLSYKRELKREFIQYLQKKKIKQKQYFDINLNYRKVNWKVKNICGKFKKYNHSHDR